MKKLLLIGSIFCFSLVSNAQEHATEFTQCQLTVDEILSQQWFDIDDPISEDARYIIFELYSELNSVFTAEANQQEADIDALIVEIEETLDKAAAIQLDLSMFDEDMAHVESLNE